jgi:hypothetical protein
MTESLQMMEEGANGMIDSLRMQIQELAKEKDSLAHDLKQAEDDLDTQTRLASRTLERRNRLPIGGVKRNRDEVSNDRESDRVSKRARSVTVINIKQEDAIDLTGDDESGPSKPLRV